MDQRRLSAALKIIIVGLGVCGLIVYAAIIPGYGNSLACAYPEFSHCYRPWLAFLWATAVPCFAALGFGWPLAVSVGKDQPFTRGNAKRLRAIGRLAAGDAAFFFAGNVALLLLNMNHPGIVLMSLLVVFVGAAIAVAARCLSLLIGRAAELQEQSDLTI